MRGKASGKRATSEAMALEIVVDAGGRRQLRGDRLGQRAHRAPAPAGVFRAGGTALDFQALQGALHLGGVQHKSLPCEGTLGRTQTFRVPSASVLFGLVADLRDVTYTHRGSQDAKRDFAKGAHRHPHRDRARSRRSAWSSTASRARCGCAARSASRSGPGSPPPSPRSRMNGQPVSVPAPGRTTELPDGAGLVQRELVKRSRYGARVIALRVTLFQQAVVMDLAPVRRAHLPALTRPPAGSGQQPRRVASRRAASPSRRAWATSGKTTLWSPTVPIRPRITQVVIRPGSTWATAWASS